MTLINTLFPLGWQHYLLGGLSGEAQHTGVPAWQLLVGGFLAGYGARLGNGCTSGLTERD